MKKLMYHKSLKLLVLSFILFLVPSIVKSQIIEPDPPTTICNTLDNISQFLEDPNFYTVTFLYTEVRDGLPFALVYSVDCHGKHVAFKKCRKGEGLCARGKVWADLSGTGDILEVMFALPDENGNFNPNNQVHTEIYECSDEEGVYVTYEL